MKENKTKSETFESKEIRRLRYDMIISLIEIAVVLIAGGFMIGYMHEKAHQAIFDSYGIESNISIWKSLVTLGAFTTTAESPCPTEDCLIANNLNEVFGYQLFAAYFASGCIGVVVYATWLRWKTRNYINSEEFRRRRQEYEDKI